MSSTIKWNDAKVADAWALIDAAAAKAEASHILDLFAQDPARLAKYTVQAPHLFFDYSKSKLSNEGLAAMTALAEATDLMGMRELMVSGGIVNNTEGRAVWHVALRGMGDDATKAIVAAGRARIKAFAQTFRTGQMLGATGMPLKNIVHIGIGGSDLGPRLVADALKNWKVPGVTLRFAANVDGADIHDALEGLNPEETLIVTVSKTFTTLETLMNAEAARAWLYAAVGVDGASKHLAAVSAAPERAQKWGVPADYVFPFWDWVGGRYSIWAAVGLSVEMALVDGAFDQFLAGAGEMDQHFVSAPIQQNAPILGAFVQTFHRVGLDATSYMMAPYARRLALLSAYLQQQEMESNGKSVMRDGRPVHAVACGVTWGDVGTNAQHSFFQLLHQGVDMIPVELLVLENGSEGPADQRVPLLANALAQAEALLVGKSTAVAKADVLADGKDEATATFLSTHKTFPGNRPSVMVGISELNPTSLGALLAYYEHRTFVQGALMGVNSFDQWGVELGKVMAKVLGPELEGKASTPHDPSTQMWIERLRR